ncbi:hypothetical protein GGS20DRAFT_581384 [Poronia punctata]|nr:hypothetical protein GGS20DRAFT_581384 [Poronia punctata]
MRDRGGYLQSIIGRNHDLITFDPRGVGFSSPRIRCWDYPEQSRLWDTADAGVVDAHPGIVYDVYARAVAFFGRLVMRRGFSYGTLLGGVFVAMYPDKVERFVSDVDRLLTGDAHIPQIITWSHVRRLTSSALYQPIALFKKYAAALAALEINDGRPVYEMINPIMNHTAENFAQFAEHLGGISHSAGRCQCAFPSGLCWPKGQAELAIRRIPVCLPLRLAPPAISATIFNEGNFLYRGTMCESDYYPFQDITPRNDDDNDDDDEELTTALHGLSGANWGFASKLAI